MLKPLIVVVAAAGSVGGLSGQTTDSLSFELAQNMMNEEPVPIVEHLKAVPDTFSFDHEQKVCSDSICIGGLSHFWVDYEGFHLLDLEGNKYFYRIEAEYGPFRPDLHIKKLSKISNDEWNITFNKGDPQNKLHNKALSAILVQAATGIKSFQVTTKKGQTLKFSLAD